LFNWIKMAIETVNSSARFFAFIPGKNFPLLPPGYGMIGSIHLESALLVYRARLRTEDVEGQVYLEMWCSFPGRGEFFSRALESPLTGTTDWSTRETPFSLQKGDNPDNVKMNLVVNGKGKVWIDDIRLIMAPLQYAEPTDGR
jgi:hypothetical protein